MVRVDLQDALDQFPEFMIATQDLLPLQRQREEPVRVVAFQRLLFLGEARLESFVLQNAHFLEDVEAAIDVPGRPLLLDLVSQLDQSFRIARFFQR